MGEALICIVEQLPKQFNLSSLGEWQEEKTESKPEKEPIQKPGKSIVTKSDVYQAYTQKQSKRNNLLYEYYREAYFTKDYTNKYIAEKISSDLELPITEGMIQMLKHRLNKHKI